MPKQLGDLIDEAELADLRSYYGEFPLQHARLAMEAWLQRDAAEKLPSHRYEAGDFGLAEDHEVRSAIP